MVCDIPRGLRIHMLYLKSSKLWIYPGELFYSFLETICVIIRLNSRYCFSIVDFDRKSYRWMGLVQFLSHKYLQVMYKPYFFVKDNSNHVALKKTNTWSSSISEALNKCFLQTWRCWSSKAGNLVLTMSNRSRYIPV